MPSLTVRTLCWRAIVRGMANSVDLPLLSSVKLNGDACMFYLRGSENMLILRSMGRGENP